MRYAFIAEHRSQFSVRVMCRCLQVHPSGYYAWQRSPLGNRAQEDNRQIELIRKAWTEAGQAKIGKMGAKKRLPFLGITRMIVVRV